MKKNGIALAIILIILVMTLVACGENDLDTCEHNVVIDEAVSATCTEMGLTEGAHCSKCGEVLLAQTEVPALGHTAADAVKENEIEPTCTTAGSYDSVVYCSVCDAELSRETKSVDALDHNIVNHNAQAPTCTEVGWEAYETCSRCDYTTYVEIPATGHNYSSDCDVICNVCEHERVSSASHSYDNSCDTTCNECGAIRTINHTYDNTCDTICNICEDVRSIEHTYSSDCDTICNVCGATRTTSAHADVNPADNSCDNCGASVSTLTFTLSDDGQSYAVTDANSSISGDITLPSTYNGKSVTTIGEYAFSGCDSLTSVTFAENSQLTTIGDYAFESCTSLRSVTIGDSVTTIGEEAFYDCASLTSVTIGDSVTSIGKKAFAYCENLTDVYYTGDIAGWCGISFGSNSANPMYYADNLYIDGKLVEDLVIPDSVTIIRGGAFWGCTSLRRIVIPDSVTTIGSYAFYNCTRLTRVTFGENSQLTTIGEGDFYNCSSLTSITIPDSVTTIGADAFSGCSSLESLTIPFVGAKAGVTSSSAYQYPLGYLFGSWSYTGGVATTQSYYGSSASSTTSTTYYIPLSLKSVTVTGGYIPRGAFYNCKNITNITIGDDVTSIGEWAFWGCSSLGSLTIPFVGARAGVTSSSTYQYPLGYLFGTSSYTGGVETTQSYYGSSASSITYTTYYIPLSLKSVTVTGGYIPRGAFYGCNNITNITLGDDVTTIGVNAFYYCDSLTDVYYTGDIAGWCGISFGSANANPMYYADNLYIDGKLVEDLVIPDSVTSIGKNAFYNCTSLTSVTIPDSVTRIGEYAFWGCSSLESLTIPFVGAKAGVTSSSTYQYPLGYLFGTSSYTGGVATTQNYYDSSTSSTTSTTYYIPSSLKSVTVTGGYIPRGAFQNCKNITNITLGDDVTRIDEYAFSGCTSLTSISVDENNPNYKSIDGNLYSKDGKTLIQYAIGKTATSFVIPDSVTTIGEEAFYYCTSLTSIVIPDSVTTIGSYAFYNLTSVTFGANSQLTTIGEYAFNSCDLTSITIPDSVTSIGEWAFGYCDSLTSVTFGENSKLTTIGPMAFYECDSLTSIVIPDSVTGIGDFAFRYCDGLTSVTIGDSVTRIGEEAFGGCSSLTSVTIGDSVTTICYSAFRHCDSLTSIVIPDSVTYIGQYAFYNCSSLTSVTFEDPNGWYVTKTLGATSGTNLTLTNTSTNANYLKSTYENYYWYKK